MIVLRTGSRLMLIYSYINMSLLPEAQMRKGNYTSGNIESRYSTTLSLVKPEEFFARATRKDGHICLAALAMRRHLPSLGMLQGLNGLLHLHLEVLNGLLLP